MVRKVKLRASVGRQRLTGATLRHEARYMSNIRKQMKTITDNYAKFVNELGDIGAEILLEALQPTFDLSQKYVPRDTGALADSGFLKKDTVSKFPRVVLGYGTGGAPHYAILVHELLHLKHASPTRAKFLLSALEEDAGNIQKRIVQGYQQATGATV